MLDCSYSVSETENFHHGDLKSDITHCGYDYIHEKVKNETDKEIEQRFYGLYLKLKPVSYFKVLHLYIIHTVYYFHTVNWT